MRVVCKKSQKGFTLIDLMIVILIIAILTAIAIPLYLGYTADSMRSDGKALLRAIVTAENNYYAKKATFTKNKEDLRVFLEDLGESEENWTISLSHASNNGFTAKVDGKSSTEFFGLWVQVVFTKDPESKKWNDNSEI